MSGFRLGSFEVLEPIASGGMGDVWRGVHVTQEIPVAIKVIRQKSGNESHFKRAFRREVRAVAKLDHPAIITLFDIGEVPEVTAAESAGSLEVGSPYLVMEYLERGSLDGLQYPLPWAKTREVLMAVLDGLGHAHARGMTHRDLKPGNILIAEQLSGSPVRLADFGIAFSYRETHSKESDGVAVGTPTHMAPEQFLGEWRDFGPWTDLYALGCVAYQLASGRLPFEQRDELGLGMAHIQQTPPELICTSDYPELFERWVMKLLEKNPEDRYRWCADAAAALQSIASSEPLLEKATAGFVGGSSVRSDWREPSLPRRPFKLIGAGLRLFGSRVVPMVGRNSERDLLWRVFGRVCEQGMPRLVLLEGAAGAGKSRLAEWLCERTHEMGLAESLRVEHDRSRGKESGLNYMLAEAWSCLGTNSTDLKERVKQILSSAGIDSRRSRKAVTELLAPAALGEDYVPGTFFKFRSRSERFSVLFEVLRRVYGDRPLVIWLDDVHWGSDSLYFLEYLLERPRTERMRVMAVLTAREDLLVDSPEASDLLHQLCQREDVECTRVEPLSGTDSRILAGSLLFLEGDLAELVSERSGGNPLYATQLVGDWVNRGILVAGTSGFVLSGAGLPEVPDDVHSVWVRRLERVLDESVSGLIKSARPEMLRIQMQIALELAAALGGRVDTTQWRSVCSLAGVADPGPVLESLLASRMARLFADGWTFSHSMLSDSVERLAREKRRWGPHNRLCADMLEQRHPVPHWGDSERIGRFRFEAAQFEAAVRPLLRGARESIRVEEYATALGLLALCERALDQLGRQHHDPQRLEAMLLRADIHCTRRELQKAHDLANRLLALADGAEAPRVFAAALLVLARVHQLQGRLSDSLDYFIKARETLRVTGPKDKLGECLSEYATALMEMGLNDEAWGAFNEAQQIYEEVGQLVPWAENQLGLARILLRKGDSDHAMALCRRVRAFAQREELGRIEAAALVVMAEVKLLDGQVQDAGRSLDEGIDLFEQLGLERQASRPRLLKVLLLLESGSVDSARLAFEQLRSSPDAAVLRTSQLFISCVEMAIAIDGSEHDFRLSVDRTAALLADTEVIAPDIARCFTVASARARSNGFPERAKQIEQLRTDIAAT